jgi:hypothetical protein
MAFGNNNWCTTTDTKQQVARKLEFIRNYKKLSKQISNERTDTMKHHLSYALKQHLINNYEQDNPVDFNKTNSQLPLRNNNRIKYKAGGGPCKDRIIVNEKLPLNLEKIEEIREYSHIFCHRKLVEIDQNKKEKVNHLILPLIKNIDK